VTQTLPAWLPVVIAGGLYAAVGFAVVGVASAAVDWADRRRAKSCAAPRTVLDAPVAPDPRLSVPREPPAPEKPSQSRPTAAPETGNPSAPA
jgi:hypothetical protein